MLKFLLIGIFLLGMQIALIDSMQLKNNNDVEAAHNFCYKKLNPPKEIFEKYKLYEFPPHSVTACYIKCFLEKLEAFDPQHGFQIDNIATHLTHKHPEQKNETINALKRCIGNENFNEDAVDLCAWVAVKFFCFMNDYEHLAKESLETA